MCVSPPPRLLIEKSLTSVNSSENQVQITLFLIFLAMTDYSAMSIYTVVNNQTKKLALVPEHQSWQF